MPIRGAPGLWLRGVAAAGACLLALASTGAMVTAAVVGHSGAGPAVILVSQGGEGQGNGGGSTQDGNGNGNGDVHGNGNAHGNGDAKKAKPPKPAADPKPKPVAVSRPASHPRPAPERTGTVQPANAGATTHTPAATPTVVVDSSDPAPFSGQTVAAADAARVLPVERLGPLSGISFGSGLFIWPVLLAVDVLALAVIARLALRRRFAAED